ncbi:hypothetical protein PGT21_012953 [Puccinia graminis f. sp. tritici]|uniref:Uncharacterized protein n=2 Tax=Puccinia graminis f. sp. tritici TaxID=56615 RepID=E3LAU2_PUCGT|nr:uncharacterized protein PGTG_19562 [Puccinia graminis f. sp. tritici CRL 75-36-700-3]EFP93667.2 hypothetical protein PGTG_19562 [Puccinia graminis f. sp. tritici CRL 75-36-700-3]KAA1069133.1 hypothetical protein PGT21_012953 [Puccinia graminis f. sp. tritici]
MRIHGKVWTYHTGHDDDAEIWEVTVLLVLISLGGRSTTVNLMSTPTSSNAGPIEQPQPNMRPIGARKTPTPASKTAPKKFSVNASQEPQQAKRAPSLAPLEIFPTPSTSATVLSPKEKDCEESEEGEVSDDENDDHFSNTYPPGNKNN